MSDWPHAPVHRLQEEGTYIVTAGTYRKQRHFSEPSRLDLLHDALLAVADRYDWRLQAWAVLPNHYHFVAFSPSSAPSLRRMISHLHTQTAAELNAMDGAQGRRVWYQFWDSRITYEKSYLARLNYVHGNAVHHGMVEDAVAYRWCSARWFEESAPPAFRKLVGSFKTDRVKVIDDF